MTPHIVPVNEPRSAAEARALAARVRRQRQEWMRLSEAEQRRAGRICQISLRKGRSSITELQLLRNIPNASRILQRKDLTKAGQIIRWCADRYGTTVEAVKGEDRAKRIVKARHLAMRLIKHSKRYRHLSLSQIGLMFGGRDHTTVLHALKGSAAAKFIPKANEHLFDPDDAAVVFRARLAMVGWAQASDSGAHCGPYYSKLFSRMATGVYEAGAERTAAAMGMTKDGMLDALRKVGEITSSRARFVSK